MSLDAKEILIKSVSQAIPTYVMEIFKLRTTMCEEMEQMIRYFWWGRKKAKGKCTGWRGKKCCDRSVKAGLDSKICACPIRPYWPDRHGN
jgi:hypothetical protein